MDESWTDGVMGGWMSHGRRCRLRARSLSPLLPPTRGISTTLPRCPKRTAGACPRATLKKYESKIGQRSQRRGFRSSPGHDSLFPFFLFPPRRKAPVRGSPLPLTAPSDAT